VGHACTVLLFYFCSSTASVSCLQPLHTVHLFLSAFCFTLTEFVTKLVVDESTILTPYVVDGLEPDTLYKFYAVSLTVAGPSYENSSLVEATTKSAGITAGPIAGIIIALCIPLVLVVIGAVTCVK